MTRWFHTRPVPACRAVLIVAGSLLPCAAAAQSAPAMPRVRSENPLIAQLIADAPGASVTFRGLVEAIDGTNGIVYVESGRCGEGARACLAHSIHVAGPNRILRIVVNLRRDRTELVGAIGHELQHALEVLREPGITTSQGMFFHFFVSSSSATRRFETKAAVEAGSQIERELRSVAVVEPVEKQDPRSLPRVRSHEPRIVDAIARGTAVSPTLRRLVDTIDATDGIVYVDDGKCGYIVRACLLPLLQVAGPSRVLRIQVNLREVHGCELIEVIGHELQHATELLADARIRTDIQAYNFFAITRVRPDSRRFETKAALQIAVVISREACGR
jgi:hypothetical protein